MLAARQALYDGIRLGRSVAIGGAGVAPAGFSSTQKVFGQTSYYNNGTVNNRITATPTTGFAFGTGNFTIELWFYPTSTAQALLVDFRPLGATGKYPIVWWSASKINYNCNQVDVIQSSVLPINVWYCVAAVRNGTTTTLYVNGSSVGTWADTSVYLVGNVAIAANAYAATGSPSITGYMDELRISNVARYSANYTPATEPFTDDPNTLLLVHFDGAVGGRTFVDDNT